MSYRSARPCRRAPLTQMHFISTFSLPSGRRHRAPTQSHGRSRAKGGSLGYAHASVGTEGAQLPTPVTSGSALREGQRDHLHRAIPLLPPRAMFPCSKAKLNIVAIVPGTTQYRLRQAHTACVAGLATGREPSIPWRHSSPTAFCRSRLRQEPSRCPRGFLRRISWAVARPPSPCLLAD